VSPISNSAVSESYVRFGRAGDAQRGVSPSVVELCCFRIVCVFGACDIAQCVVCRQVLSNCAISESRVSLGRAGDAQCVVCRQMLSNNALSALLTPLAEV
jgi:hypothetical protein